MGYEIIKKLGIIQGDRERFHIEANIISWEKEDPKLDIRRWIGDTPGRGVCLNEAGLKKLREILKDVTL